MNMHPAIMSTLVESDRKLRTVLLDITFTLIHHQIHWFVQIRLWIPFQNIDHEHVYDRLIYTWRHHFDKEFMGWAHHLDGLSPRGMLMGLAIPHVPARLPSDEMDSHLPRRGFRFYLQTLNNNFSTLGDFWTNMIQANWPSIGGNMMVDVVGPRVIACGIFD